MDYGVLSSATAPVMPLIYPTPLGQWLRRRLERAFGLPEIDVPLARCSAALDGLRIAFISDVHAGGFMEEEDLERICARVNRASPDVVCLGGDLVNKKARETLLLTKPFATLEPRLGVFAVPGNHDHVADPDLRIWSAALAAAGVRVLDNEGVRLDHAGASFWLAGVDDLGRGHPDLSAAMRGASEDEPIVLLSHEPDFFHESAWAGVDLTLSGHTHGGQITWRGRPFPGFKHTRLGYWQGLYTDEDACLYVGRGAGTTFLPLRIGAPPEVPILVLRAP
jgi:predicted MPP superfamily phosphohydrolase